MSQKMKKPTAQDIQKYTGAIKRRFEKTKQQEFFFQEVIQTMSLDDDKALNMAELYPDWNPNGILYKVGMIVKYGIDEDNKSILYRVTTQHTSQELWNPINAPSNFDRIKIVEEGYPPWVQPMAHNLYMKGDRVTHVGKVWESSVNNNGWEPGTHGSQWVEII